MGEYKLYHVTYFHMKDRSEEQKYVLFPIWRGEPDIRYPVESHSDLKELRKKLRAKGFQKSELETVIEYHQKIYLPDSAETERFLSEVAKNKRKSLLLREKGREVKD